MRFLITMHMPSAVGNLVHQVTVEHPAKGLDQFCKILNADIFIICRNFYRRTDNDGSMYWEDRGDIILNTAHIGKVQVFVEQEKGWSEEAQVVVDRRFEGQRGPMRQRRS